MPSPGINPVQPLAKLTEITASPAQVQRGRFSVNLLASFVNLGLSGVVGIWYVSFLVRNLGAAAYGLIPLAATLTSYLSLITVGMNLATARGLTISLEQSDHDRANRIFNTALMASVALTALLLLPAAWIVWNIQRLIHIPSGYEAETRWLFAGTISAFLLTQLRASFDASSFCRNRFDLRNLIQAGETVTRVGLVIMFFSLIGPRIEYVAVGALVGTLFAFWGAVRLWKRLTPNLRIRVSQFDRPILGSMARTGGWILVNQVGAVVLLSMDLLLANLLLGAEASGRYAAILQPAVMIRTIGCTVGAMFAPTIISHFATKDMEALVTSVQRGMKFLGLFLVLPIGLACGFAGDLLRVWLGEGFVSLWPLLILVTIHLCVNMAIQPILGVQLATDSYKVPALATLVAGACNLALAIVLVGRMHWGLYGIAVASAVTLLLKNVLFTTVYAAHLLRRPFTTFCKELAPLAAATCGLILFCRGVAYVRPLANWIDLGIASGAVSVVYAAIVYTLLKPAERGFLENTWQQIRRNYANRGR